VPRPFLVASIIAGAIVLGTIAAGIAATVVWRRDSRRAVERIAAVSHASPPGRPTRFTRDQLIGLPPPVARYFEFALTPNQRLVERARIRWAGDFSIGPHEWRSFTATQHYAVHPPGFVWNASISMLPLVPVRVRDSYVIGEGSLLAAIGGFLRVANEGRTREMAEGELIRYLGEAVWFPTALLPSAGVTWRAIDDSSATATLTDGATTVSIDVHFAPSGEIVRVTAIRPREVNGTFVPTPWLAHLTSYEPRSGMMIPMAGDVEWDLPSGGMPYWRARLTDVSYDFD
jgi:hypothetical protein